MLALVVALLLSPVTNSFTHGPAAHPEAAASVTQDLSHGHGHDADTPTGHHDSTDHDHPSVALIPPQPATALPPLPDLPRPAPQLSDGRERGNLLRPPRAAA
ncbi:hypothetical protein HYN69_19115 (plasmid) [Gemmobacter aquarius]|uniref:Secreted protein n=2 Tax=Paragemmobacter aquarius TaxID=2169400 RepID=A0A2S0USA7_9RHOB|nr:hypothetical protein HYN69_19115 [Gemmobacter aquarius]